VRDTGTIVKLPSKFVFQTDRLRQLRSSEETRSYTGSMHRVMLLTAKYTPHGVPCISHMSSSCTGECFRDNEALCHVEIEGIVVIARPFLTSAYNMEMNCKLHALPVYPRGQRPGYLSLRNLGGPQMRFGF
jgi:hypothetical protein